MSGTKEGYAKAKAKMLAERFGGSEEAMKEWQASIGKKGGEKSRGGGFTNNPELASKAGKKGAEVRYKKSLQ